LKAEKIHIDEENTQIIWGLVAVVSIGLATYMLINAFMAGSWQTAGYTQIAGLILFTISFYGIVRISSPLFHFVMHAKDQILTIEIWREGDQPLDVQTFDLSTMQELRIAPHAPRSPNEALFDFSSSYYLLYRNDEQDDFHRLIDLEDESFTLKVEDIGKIMKFIFSHNSSIEVPADDALFMNINQPDSMNRTIRG
jgi:hypothetical protein